MLCPTCLSSNPDENRFCGKCGGTLPARSNVSGFATKQEPPKRPAGNDSPTVVIDLDKKSPFSAHPGTDRRGDVSDYSREPVRDEDEREKRRDAETVKFSFKVPSLDKTVQLPSNFLEGTIAKETAKTEAKREAPRRSEPARKPAANGFLNLDYDPKAKSSGSVLELADEEPEVSHTRRNVVLLLLLVAVGVGAWQWQAIHDQTLPFVQNGAAYIKAKVMGLISPDANQQAHNTTPAPPPKTDTAPANPDLNKPEPTATTDQTAANTTTDAAKPDTSTTDTSAETSTTETPTKASAKKAERKPAVTEAETRKPKKPTAQDRPQIAVEESQGGKEELAQASATSDPVQQSDWLWKAVRKGNSEASVRLAEMYIAGRGVTKSCDQALVLLRSASAHNNSRARGKLGAMYATGECVQQDRVQAYHWMTLALQANPSSSWTAQYRDSLWNQMTAGEKMRAGGDR